MAVLAGFVMVASSAGPARAGRGPSPTGPATPGSGTARLELVAQDPWTPVGGDVSMRLDITNPPPGATVGFSVYQAVTARKTYDATMLGGQLSPVPQIAVPVDALPVDDRGARIVTLGLQSPTGPRDPDRLNVRRGGVYPMDVELRDADDEVLATFRTALIVAEADRAPVAEPLRVAWVWPLVAPPSFLPSGEPDRDVIAAFRPDGRLGTQAVALAAVPDVPVTLAPAGETIEAWSAAAHGDSAIESTADALRAAATTRLVLDGTYVPVNLPALLDHGFTNAVDETLLRGSEVLQAAFGRALERRTRLVRPVSPAVLGRLRAAGTERVVVDAGALVPASGEPRYTPAQPVYLDAPVPGGNTERVSALVTDPGLQGILTADLPPALRAQLVLGGLAVVAQELPSTTRVVTIVNPDDLDAEVSLYTGLLAGLRNNPYLRAVTVTEALDTVPADPVPTVNPRDASSDREVASVPTPALAITATDYREQRLRLNAFGALTRPGDPAVGQADRSLLASVSSMWPLDIGRARSIAHLHVVDRVIQAFLSRIEVPDPRTITLTSRSGQIPLTFRNETGHPVRLRASLSSAKLFFPEGAVLDLELPPKSTTVRVAVEARTSGTFPLNLEVTSTDGVLPISHRRLEVRSTFVSTVGVVLMVSAAVFLAGWWGLDLRRRRRHARAAT